MAGRRATPAAPPGFVFRRRAHPSANSILVGGRWPILVDTGFVTAVADRIQLVETLRFPHDLGLGVLTHFHSDHAGGAGVLRKRFGVPIALHGIEAVSVNSRRPDACDVRWLHHPIDPFCVDMALEDGEVLTTGATDLSVVHVPGQTPGHIALFSEADRVLISGDMPWLPPLTADFGPCGRRFARWSASTRWARWSRCPATARS